MIVDPNNNTANEIFGAEPDFQIQNVFIIDPQYLRFSLKNEI